MHKASKHRQLAKNYNFILLLNFLNTYTTKSNLSSGLFYYSIGMTHSNV